MKIPYCDCIDENWKALKARIQASLTAVKLNGKTYYQTDGTGICDLGNIEVPSKASEITLDDGRTVEQAISDDESAIAGKVNTVDITEVTDGINMTVTKDTSTKQTIVFTVDDTLAVTGKTVGISDSTDARITRAQTMADTAQATAEDAQADADNAMSAATTAQNTAGTALGKAETAITNAATAQATAVTAQATAETALEDAETAQTTADNAIANAKTAQTTADTAVANAATAQTTANNALTKASNAQTDASTAITKADTAQATADHATTIATTAKQTADTAIDNAETAQTTADTAVATANTAKENAESAVSTANSASSTASTAYQTAVTAKTTAETADANADDALEKANSAVSTANSASSTASTAYQTAVTAKTTAETAEGKADNAQTDATSALSKIKSAIVGFVTSVSGKVLNATITKSDGTTSTTPVFTAGNNLSWNGTTLNAVGGTAYEGGTAISLVDGAFNLNAGDGLSINATDNTVNVDTATTDALDTRVTAVENAVTTAQADADKAIVGINRAVFYGATAQAYGISYDTNTGSSNNIYPIAVNTDDFAVINEHIDGIAGTVPVFYISDAVKDDISTAVSKATSAETTANSAATTVASKQDTITGGATTITSDNLTASRVLISNSSGKVAASSTTSTELAYLNGVTSKIQTQLNARFTNIATATGTIDAPIDSFPTYDTTMTAYLSGNSNKQSLYMGTRASTTTTGSAVLYYHRLAGGLKILHGSFNGYANSTAYASVTFTVPTNYAFYDATSYTVIATVDDNSGKNLWSYQCRVKRTSGTSFTIYTTQGNSDTTINQNCRVNWIAIGV